MAGVLLQVLVGALLFASGVSFFCRVVRPRPALCHALWLLVVVKLLVPPVFAWPWQPEVGLWEKMAFPARARALMPGEPTAEVAPPPFGVGAPPGSARVATEAETAGSGPKYWLLIPDAGGNETLVRVPLDAASTLPRLKEPFFSPAAAAAQWPRQAGWAVGALVGLVALGLWFGGAIVSVGVHASRIRRFRRAMGSSEPGPPWLTERVAELAEAFGVRAPEVFVAEGLWSAMVWGVIRPAILVPRRALEEMAPEKWETVVAHELAHLKRRDHWAAWVVLVASCVWWWNPLVWWARRRIADYAEMACDAWVLWALPERGREYADTLVQFVQAHSATPAVVPDPMPCMSCDRARAFKKRLAAILRGPSPSRLGVAGVVCLVVLAAIVLPVFSQEAPVTAPDVAAGQTGEAGARSRGSATPPNATSAADPAQAAVTQVGEPAVAAPALPEAAAEVAEPKPPVATEAVPEQDGAALALEPTVAPQAQQGAEQTQGEPVQVQRPGETQQAPEPPKAEPGQAQEASQGQQPLEPAQAQGPSEAEKAPATQALELVLHASQVADPFNVGTVSEELKEALSSEVSLDFTDVPLTDFVDFISNTYRVNIVIDWRVVEAPRPVPRAPGQPAPPGAGGHVLAEGCVTDGVVPYVKLRGVALGEAVRVFARTLNLTVVTYPHILFITSEERALADLSLPRPGLPPYASSGEVLSSEVSLDFQDAHIVNFTEFFSETYGVNIMLDWRVIPRPGVSPASAYTPKVSPARVPRILVTAAPLGETLDVLLRSINLTFYPKENYLWISSFEETGASSGHGGLGMPGVPGAFPGAPGPRQNESRLPYFEVLGIFRPEDGSPPIAFIRIPEKDGQPAHNVQVPLGESFDGVKIVGLLPDGKGIVVELADVPGITYKVGPPQQVFTPLPPASAAGGFGGGAAGGIGGGAERGTVGEGGISAGIVLGGRGLGGADRRQVWDTFESQTAGTWAEGWIADGNCSSGACYVDGSTFGPAHGKVLRLMGEDPAMSPIAHVETKIRPPFRISFDVFMDGADPAGECVVGVRERPDWQAPGVLLFSAPLSGPARALERVAAEGRVFPGQAADQVHLEAGKWYRVVLDLKQESGRDQLSVTMDDGQKVQGPVELTATGILVKDMPYLQLEMRTGVAWFDNVVMTGL